LKQIGISWADLLLNLREAGMAWPEISRALRIPIATLQGYAWMGSVPPHHRGECIVMLWCERTGKARDAVPMTDIYRAERVARR
jgi:hypothetical protein